MTWARFDDSFYDHPKVIEAGDAAVGLFVRLVCYSNRHLTDGKVTPKVIANLTQSRSKVGAKSLVQAGLLDEVDGGYLIHDFGEYNHSAAEIKEKRAKDAARKRGDSTPTPHGVQAESSPPVPSRPVPSRKKAASAAPPLFVTDDEVDLLYAHYKIYHPQAAKKVSKKRRRLLDAGIKNHGLDHCKASIDGYHVSPYHTGENERGTKYLSLELIFRDDDHIEAGIAMAASPPRKKSSNMAGVEIFLDSLRKEDESARESERRSRGVWSGDGEAPWGVRGGQLAREGVGGDDQQLLAPPQPIPGAGEGSDVFDGTEEVPRPVPDGRSDGGARRGPPEG